mgnify:CR=1 FL=1
MNTAHKGRAFEHEIRHLFEREGYSVIRGAASKGFFDSPSGVVKPDLVASKTDRNKRTVNIILIQAKVRG